jgi:carbon monoxide dehydrogenase subunit G
MEMKGEQLVPASRQQVWDALNDPAALKACIPGCESIEPSGANAYQVLMVAKVGPVSAKFKGKLTLSDVKPPESYSIAFEGQGGAAGFAKGGAKVNLSSQSAHQTTLAYAVTANVGGKLAQIGSRLVDAAARKVADDFFARFNARFSATSEEEHHDEYHPEPVPRDPDLPTASDTTLMFFAAGSLLVVLVSLASLIA